MAPYELTPLKKQRLDLRLLELGLAPSRHKAQALIQAGSVLVDGVAQTKAGFAVGPDRRIDLAAKERFVGRGGLKLQGALEDFAIVPAGKNVLDIGASTGGFTDCLLQNGASHVTAVDVGYGQIDSCLRKDARVTLKEKTNARYLKPSDFPDAFDLAVIDVSFISLEKILPAVLPLLRPSGEVLALIKPQFEAGRAQVKKGVVRDPAVHEAVIAKIRAAMTQLGLDVLACVPSRLQGPKGNIEFFMLGKKGSAPN